MTNFAPGSTVISTYAYTLDGVGNRTQVDLNEPMMPSYNAETINYTYFLGNILNTADGNTYTHDANGNRIQKSGSGGITTYTYDSLNRLVQVVKGSQTTQYSYNGLGQRVGKIDNGVQTNYLVDPNGILPQILTETDTSNNLISFYVYDGAGLVAKITPQNQYYFYHYDGLGNTIAITDNAGQVVNTYCYSPEGLVGAQETIPNPFQYVGRFGVMAEGNGHYYMGARYYDPEVGRFINRDPIGYAGGLNLYGYVGNNFPNYIDPLGLLRFKLFDMPIDIKVSASFLPINIAWDLGGFSSNNFSYNAIFPPLTVGIGVDISINPPSSCEEYISPYVGLGRNWSWGTNVSLASKGKEPIKLKVQGVNISFGPSVGLPGATIPGGLEDNEKTWDKDGLKDRRFDKK
jgi:RHS repeat-associated protein